MIYINRGLGIKCGPSDEAAVVLGTMTSGNVVTVDALGNLIDGALPVGIAVDIKGGSAGEIPFQSGSSTTTFTSGLVWNTSYGLETTIPYGEMWHHYGSGAGPKQFRGTPFSTSVYSFDMTAV